MIGRFLVLFCAVVFTGAQAQTCQWQTGAIGFLNCIGTTMQTENNKILGTDSADYFSNTVQDYTATKQQAILSAFAGTQCPAPNLDQDILQFIQDPQYQMPAAVIGLSQQFDQFFWLVYGSRPLASCFLTYLLNKFLSYEQSCAHLALPSASELNPIPLPPEGADDTKIRKYLNMYLMAYIALQECNAADQQTIIRQINKENDDNVCSCTSSFVSTGCQSNYDSACPNINGCIVKLVDDPGKIVDFDEMKNNLINCAGQQTSATQNYVKASTIAHDGLALKAAFDKTNTDPANLAKFGKYVQSVLKVVFHADFCQTCKL